MYPSVVFNLRMRRMRVEKELQKQIFVVDRRATWHFKALMSYFKLDLSKHYLHTSGPLYAHTRHIVLIGLLKALLMCLLCATCVQISVCR